MIRGQFLGEKSKEYVEAAKIIKSRFPKTIFQLGGRLDSNPTSISSKELKVWINDKLIMNVETNGTVDAEDAIAYSARIFQDQLSMFVNFEDPQEVVKEVK